MLRSASEIALVLVLAGCNAAIGWDVKKQDRAPGASNVTVTSAVTSAEHTCALVIAEGKTTAACWGRNTTGQLGTGDTTAHLEPTAVTGLPAVTSIGTGLLHSCAIDTTGAVWCWGSNMYAALGRGTRDSDPHPKPERVAGISDATAVHCGMNFTCVETKGHTASCWGTNDFGQLGDGTTESMQVPQPIFALSGVASLSTGSQHACAVSNGQVYCWGYNDHGQLGSEPSTDALALRPEPVSDIDDAVSVVTSDAHTCAITAGGKVKCWGANDAGQLGVAASADQSDPVEVEGLDGVETLSLGTKHTCAKKNDELWCWGSNLQGQLAAKPTLLRQESSPRRIIVSGLLEQIEQPGAQGDHTCAIRVDQTLVCWGFNGEGQLGNGTRKGSSTPREVHFDKVTR